MGATAERLSSDVNFTLYTGSSSIIALKITIELVAQPFHRMREYKTDFINLMLIGNPLEKFPGFGDSAAISITPFDAWRLVHRPADCPFSMVE